MTNTTDKQMRKGSLLTIFLIVFIDLMGFGIMLPNLQLYGKRFGIASYFTLTLLGASYSLFQFIFSPILGSWSDRIGRRPVLLISQAGTLFGFLLLFAAHFFEGNAAGVGIAILFASRIIDGISGGNISAAAAYIADSTTPENRAKGMGIIGAAFGLGFVFGPVLGGVIGGKLGLEWVPLTSAFFSLTALCLTFFILHESLDPAHATSPGELRRYTLTGLWKPLARPIIGPMIAMSFVNGFAFAGMEQTYSLLVYKRVYEPVHGALSQSDWQAAVDKAGQNAGFATGMLLFMVGMIIAIVQGGMIHRLTKKFGEARLMIAGPIFIGVGMLILAADLPLLFPGLWKWSGFMLGSFFLATGSSIFNPAVQSLVSRHASPREQGEILGDLQGMASLARALGPITAGLLFQFVMAGTVYQGAAPYYLSGVLTIFVGLWALAMRRKLTPPQARQAAPSQTASQGNAEINSAQLSE
jgi:DHA1 family tetracycline resistance protein-like MFS transporter